MLKVGQLQEHLGARHESAITARLGDFEVTDDATVLTVNNHDEHRFPLDDVASAALAKFLKVPPSYYHRLTPQFRATLLRYHFDHSKEANAVVESLGEEIIAVHQPSQTMVPMSRVVEVVEKTFSPEDTVRRLITSESLFHLDVVSSGQEIATAVGDITQGGVRFLSAPFQSKPPSVSTYLERLVCLNGMTTPERLGRIAIKGRTVDEVIAEMEEAAQILLTKLDDQLFEYAKTREMTVPGSPAAFVAQLAREADVSRRVLDAVLEIVNQLEEPVSIWDVQNAFTTVANQVDQYSTMTRLQSLGGALALDAPQMIHRCKSCERLLVDSSNVR